MLQLYRLPIPEAADSLRTDQEDERPGKSCKEIVSLMSAGRHWPANAHLPTVAGQSSSGGWPGNIHLTVASQCSSYGIFQIKLPGLKPIISSNMSHSMDSFPIIVSPD